VGHGRVVAYDAVVTAAERLFHRTERLDMDELAREVSVSRATLYRVVGSRDRVLGDVLWRQGSRLLDRVAGETQGTGVDRLVRVAERFDRRLLAYPPLRRLLREEPQTAFRVLLMAEAGVHSRFVTRWRELLEQAERDGELTLPLAAEDAAYVFVRIGESMLYSELLGDRQPDPTLAAQVQRVLLGAAP
jgi:AcrR family transcriptional regulator